MKAILAFKKTDSKGKVGLFSKLIKWWTKSDYSHVEIILREKWISSNSHLGGVTVRELGPLKDNWDYVEVKVNGMRERPVNEFIESQSDKKYDWSGIVWAQVFHITRGERQNKWFCSEICSEILRRFEDKKIAQFKSADMSPQDLYKLYS